MISTDNLVKLDFNNTKIAFQQRSDKDLEKAYWLFKLVSKKALIKVGTPITSLALKAGLPIKGIIRDTIYNQFCGGESIEGCAKAIKELGEANIMTILDYAVEGEESEKSFDHTCAEILATVAYAQSNKYIPFCVFKPTGVGSFALFAKVDAKKPLSDKETAAFARAHERIDRICKACYEAGVKVLIDAEHSWIQETIDDFAREMMERYNKERVIVYNTYQLYRHDKLASLQADLAYAETRNFYLGAKIVRGAYMEIERKRAKEQGYRSPIQPDKDASDRDYNEAIRFCLDHIDQVGLMAGTHNEASSKLLANEMMVRGISPANDHIFFSQLLGMSDNLSFNLAEAGYNVAKYMPYGPVKAVMPYLFRRAQENSSVTGQTGRELSLLEKEQQRRKALK